MESDGMPHGRIVQVRGFADQSLRDKENPEAASNRRISVIVRYQATPEPEPEPEKKAEKPAEHH
jgi:chemotaxis protein MotB